MRAGAPQAVVPRVHVPAGGVVEECEEYYNAAYVLRMCVPRVRVCACVCVCARDRPLVRRSEPTSWLVESRRGNVRARESKRIKENPKKNQRESKRIKENPKESKRIQKNQRKS